MPDIVIKLISEGKAKFDGCKGPFTLPTDLSSIKDIEKIDLSSLGKRLQGRTIPSGTFFCFWRTSAQFLKKFLLSEFYANFLEWLAELAENSWIFLRSSGIISLTHTCPASLSILISFTLPRYSLCFFSHRQV